MPGIEKIIEKMKAGNRRMEIIRNIEYFRNLPYTRIIQELDGCQSTGDNIEELYENLNEAIEGYLEVKLERGLEIPEPENVENYSGKFVVRIPKTLHQRLAIEAEKEGVSLNQYALYKLAR